MGDQDGGEALGQPQAPDLVLKGEAGQGVELAEGLVQEEEPGPVDQGAGQGGALGHAARQGRRVGVGEVPQPHQLQGRGDAAPIDLEAPPGLGAEGDIVPHGPPRQERGVLEDEGPLGRRTGDRLAIDEDLSPAWRLQARQEAQDRRLAAAGLAHQGDEFAGVHPQVDVVEDLQARGLGPFGVVAGAGRR